MLILLFAVIAMPVVIAIARDKPVANIAMVLACCLGCPVIGWFIGMWFALED